MRRSIAAALLSTLAVALSGRQALGQSPYSNPELGFTLTVPSEFLGQAPDPLGPRGTIMCWITLPTPNRNDWVELCAERSSGQLPASVHKMKFTWKGLDLDGATFQSRRGTTDIVVFTVRVPLRKLPLTLSTFAPVTERARAQSALVAVLSTLQGESAESSTERAERAGSRFGFIATIVFAIGVGMWIMQRRRKNQSG